MCYTGQCPYEDYYGDCHRPRSAECPNPWKQDDPEEPETDEEETEE
jgi:hypothetical protein